MAIEIGEMVILAMLIMSVWLLKIDLKRTVMNLINVDSLQTATGLAIRLLYCSIGNNNHALDFGQLFDNDRGL